MSYALTLGAAVSASASTQAEATLPEMPEVPELPDCSDAAVTGNDYIDKTFVECCKDVKRNWDKDLKAQAKGVAECAARGAATGACVAGGVVTFGITTLLAPLCGEIGAFVANRVMGYSATQIVGGLVAGSICTLATGVGGPLCALVAAELIGWLSDNVGPIIEGIFDPGAAKRRELAARKAYRDAIQANEKAALAADDNYRLAWGLGVRSIRELYLKAFPTPALQAKARTKLGFGPVYDEIAKAMRDAGAATHSGIFKHNRGKTGCFGGHPDWECPGCEMFEYVRDPKAAKATHATGTGPWQDVVEAWVVDGRKDPWSDTCPFSMYRYYHTERAAALGTSPSRDSVTQWEKSFKPQIEAVAARIYPAMVAAISAVAAMVVSLGSALKEEELIAAAKAATKEQLATRVNVAASRAEAAADAALKGSSEEGKRSVTRAFQQYEIAQAAYDKLLEMFGSGTSSGAKASRAAACARDAYCKRAAASLARARAAKESAPIFAARAARKRLLIGSAVVATFAGGAYLLSKKSRGSLGALGR